jgi:hypothetical protein
MPDQISALVNKALKDADKADGVKGKAQQMLAACINAQFELDRETPPTLPADKDGVTYVVTMPAFSDLTASKLSDNAKVYRKLLIGRFITAPPVIDKNTKDKDTAKRAKQNYAKQYRMLIDAITLTNALLMAGGGQVSFDVTASLFSFPAAMLLPADHQAIGQLDKAIKTGSYIPLDGKLWRAEDSENSEISLNASIAQVVKSHNSRHGIVPRTRSNGSQSNSKGGEQSTEAVKLDLEGQLKSLSLQICADKEAEYETTWIEEVATHLRNIQTFVHECLYKIDPHNPINQRLHAVG